MKIQKINSFIIMDNYGIILNLINEKIILILL